MHESNPPSLQHETSGDSKVDLLNMPDPSRLIHGLRDTGYDLYTACADVIDNSIAANAKEVNIRIELAPDGRKFVFFGDNGDGMDKDGLQNALRYGADQRQILKSLGKFGLGLKTASSSVCLKFGIISRMTPDAPLAKLAWDLEHVEAVNRWEMVKEPITADEEELFEELCGEKGTLVVWEKCDRLLSKGYEVPGGTKEQQAVNYRIKKLKEHCALIFHKYLNPSETAFSDVRITVNGEEVEYWNPFYPEKSEQVLPEAQTNVPIQLEDGTVQTAKVKAWILPHSKDMTEEENRKYAKISNRGQGFYIHREGRVIHYGGYLGLWRSDDPHWSLFRIEFDFGAELDEAFAVDVKKSRILLDPGLEDGLKKLLAGAYREADLRYRRKQKVAVTGGVSHKDANKTIGETGNKKTSSVEGVDSDAGEATVTNNRGHSVKIVTPVQSNVDPAQLYVQAVEDITTGYLWEPHLTSATSVNHATGVRLNKNHDFYTKIYSQARSGVSVEGMDLLLWALAAAEQNNTDSELQPIWEDIREEVSSNLRKLLRLTPLPQSGADADDSEDSE
ncbi:ATP-binding protein [Actomonas aquatica]|uniref:ATP-binding protein n=1 Tax=Actomonas aquatica TaxID=2866162 RepID=A0ABZ1C9K0_9BACT|nr:ATP-binding protein [Opitutus sp. WL0086]WRQ87264.1 ATP-binding protein [Opitutus sp. WL0086]